MSDAQNNLIPDLPADGASVLATIVNLERQLLQIWQGNFVHRTEMDNKEVLLIKEKVMFLNNTITNMTTIILEQAGTIQKLRLTNERFKSDVSTLKSESSSALTQPNLKKGDVEFEQLPPSSIPNQPPPSSLCTMEMADMSNQADIVSKKVGMLGHSAKLAEIFNDWKSNDDEASDSEEESLLIQLEGSNVNHQPLTEKFNVNHHQPQPVSSITSTVTDSNTALSTVSYTATEPKLEVEDVMAAATTSADITRYTTTHPTNSKLQQVHTITNNKAKKEGQAWISHMTGVTDRLRKKYAVPKDKRRDMQYKKGKRPSIVPRYMASIWKLYLAPPPKPVHVPDPRPVVNWASLNPNAARNLPKPVLCPVKGVSQDQAMYETKQKLDCFTNRTEIVESPFASKTAPFGTLRGLQTNLGVVAMPEVAIQGFVWSELYGDWVIAAIGD